MVQSQYLIKQEDATLARAFSLFSLEKGFDVGESKLTKMVSLIKERAHSVSEFWEMSEFFFLCSSNSI
jgi:glutamyl-tRNA synthetase